MSIKPTPNGYEVDCRPSGRNGKRYRKKFKTKGEALKFERWLIAEKNQHDWIDKPKSKIPLSELIDSWFHYHGQQLKSGSNDLRHLQRLDKELGQPKAYQVTKNLFMDYRSTKLASGIKASTINRIHNRLSGVFTTLITAGKLNCEHPLKGLSKLKEPAHQMGFLSKDEIKLLLDALSGDPLKIAKLCLATGARWSEAANLRGANLVAGKVIFIDTKNGKNRAVPIRPELLAEIYTGKSGPLFKSCYREFYHTLKGIDVELPKGQAAHALRHTFASHFIMSGGNILTLQKILGHATIIQTMSYAHLSPDYLNEAMELNPLSTL
ncbi:tyrosine-type recombinase/integrase [Shewanella sp. D64]|uniref:phage integrase n=1 Tax=unclassified Shewanella TaxID=196818 RepID=UPI0022BA6FD4|nr:MULTISPECIES: tyrosine-type recombinase/integrase [unclassified Shewanella]MEC4729066.1 tyrosine-type recombinase/integrase [Shewanella sp. D64]MEC4740857.1 tyrosine-type recombinase/integrase [Shewanella sp. E94]WBJ95289.1 tyrosine-type recombinase/integrase [Shewanella sp. MTB7]